MPAQPVHASGSARRRDRRDDRTAAGSPSPARPGYATGNRSTPSLTTARATASASIWGEMPAWVATAVGGVGRARAARGEAEIGQARVGRWLCADGGRCCDGDGVAELFELGDEPAGLPLGVLARREVVVAEVLEHLAGAQQMPDQLDQRVGDGDGCLVRARDGGRSDGTGRRSSFPWFVRRLGRTRSARVAATGCRPWC